MKLTWAERLVLAFIVCLVVAVLCVVAATGDEPAPTPLSLATEAANVDRDLAQVEQLQGTVLTR